MSQRRKDGDTTNDKYVGDILKSEFKETLGYNFDNTWPSIVEYAFSTFYPASVEFDNIKRIALNGAPIGECRTIEDIE